MTKLKGFLMIGLIFFVLGSCKKDDEDTKAGLVEYKYDFATGMEEWTADFADYPIGESDSYNLMAEYSMLPEPLNNEGGAIKVSGTNMSDDLFMFLKREVTGLEPNTMYNVEFMVTFASDVPDGLAGVGGSPGESVYIKAGAVATEPVPVEDDMDYYRMNIDKGNQSQGGNDMIVLGDFSNDTDKEEYTLKTVGNESSFTVTTDANGSVWLIVGTDSGFEATTTIYYSNIVAGFSLLNY